MATSLQPDQSQNPSDTPDNSPPSPDSQNPADSQSPPIQPTNQPTPPATDRYTQILEATLREQNQRIQALHSDLQAVRQTPPVTEPAAPVQGDPTEFFNNPQGVLKKFQDEIRKELQETVKPLVELARGFRGDGTPYGNLKQQFASDPRYSAALTDPKVSYAVDEIMKQQSPTPDLMKAAIIQALGLKATGELDMALVASGVDINRFNTAPTSQPTYQPPAPTPPVSTVPAHMRPTAPAAPVPQSNPASAQPLTELEKRLARERGMTDEQYRAWLTVPAHEVVTSTIGRTAK